MLKFEKKKSVAKRLISFASNDDFSFVYWLYYSLSQNGTIGNSLDIKVREYFRIAKNSYTVGVHASVVATGHRSLNSNYRDLYFEVSDFNFCRVISVPT